MIYRSTIEQVDEYRNSPALSQSYIRDVILKGKPLKTKFKESITGDVVDMYLTMPDAVEDFYTVYEGPVPSAKLMEILVSAMEYLLGKGELGPDISKYRGLILKIANENAFDMAKTDAVKFSQILTKAGAWWQFVTESSGKNVITEKERSFGAQIAKLAEGHRVSGMFFQDAPGRDFYYQKPIYFQVNGVECKALLDLLVVSHVKKVVMDVEIKTIFMSTSETIASQIKQYNYPDQLSFYREAIKSILKEVGAEGYAIESKWLFIPKDIREEGKYFNPVVWPFTEEMDMWARYGGTLSSGSVYKTKGYYMESKRTVKGWEEGIQIYKNVMVTGAKTFALPPKAMTDEDANQLYFT
jgi:hypothetical protein